MRHSLVGTCRAVLAACVLATAAPAFAQDPGLGSVDCSDVQTNAQVTVVDPEGDVAGNGGTCPNPVNYGFDYGQVSIWYDQDGTGDLYFCVGTHGNIGDSDQDGGFHTESAVCGGRPDCVNQEGDPFGNVFASGIEQITWAFDRDCDGFTDLLFTLTGSNSSRADSVIVSIDVLTNHVNDILGGRGVAWEGENVQRNADVICDVDREGAVIIRIEDWRKYFTSDGTEGGDILPGLSPNLFQWIVNGGNNADSYNEDLVDGNFNETDPRIQIEKTADPTSLCGIGDETTITLTVTNTGDEVLTNVAVADTLPVGLAYVAGSASLAPTSVVGQVITWSGLTLQPAEVLVITFDAEKTADCEGEVTNIATVEATFSPLCFETLGLDPVTLTDDDTFPIDCVGADVEVVLTDGISSCVGEPVNVPGTVTNNSTEVSDITVTPYINGVPGAPLNFPNVAPGGVNNFNILVSCATPGSVTVRADALAAVDGSPDCTDTDSDETTVVCEEACVEFSVPAEDTTLCVGQEVNVPFTIRNCATSAESLVVTPSINDVDQPTQIFANVAGGGTIVVEVPVTCDDGGTITVEVNVAAYLRSNPDCSDEASDDATVTCIDSGVEIEKSTSPSVTDSCTTVTITVTNTGDSVLDPVIVSDCFPTGLTFDPTQTIGGTCEAVLDEVVPGSNGFTCIYFEPITLDPDESCTITYDLCCGTFDNASRVDTATVNAWCDGTFDSGIDPITDSDTALVVCRQEAPSLECWMTGGGCLNVPDERRGMKMHSFGGNVGPPAGSSWEHIVREKKRILFNFHSFDAQVDSCWHDGGDGPCHPAAEPNNITWSGTGVYSEGNGSREFEGTFEAHVIDAGEPGSHDGSCGSNDFYEITVYDSKGGVVFHAEGPTTCGNLQIHPPVGPPSDGPKGGEDRIGLLEPVSESAPLAVARPVPNPFRAGTRIDFAITGDQGQDVHVEVYDVAGRLVRRVEKRFLPPGQYEAEWDGRDTSGAGAPGGIYFMRIATGKHMKTWRVVLVR